MSEASLKRGLALASKLYNELEALGARVVIGPPDRRWSHKDADLREVPAVGQTGYYQYSRWSPIRPTLAFFGETPVAIAVLEMTEEVLLRYVGGDYIRETEYLASARRYRNQYTWTTSKELPSGRIRVFAFSPEGIDWSLTWQEKGNTTLDASLPRISKEIRAAIPNIVAQVEEARRQAELRRLEWQAAEARRQRAEDQRKVAESHTQSRAELDQVLKRWADRMSVERFLAELAEAVRLLPDADREEASARLRLAREFLGSTDPMSFFRSWRAPREIYEPLFNQDIDE